MTQPPPGGYPPPEQHPTGGQPQQPGPAGPPPAGPPPGAPGGPPPAGPPQGAPAGPPPGAPGGPPPAGPQQGAPAGPPPGAPGGPPPAGPPPGYAPPPGGYPPPPAGAQGYPPPPQGQPGYPQQGGYPPQQGQPAYAGAPGASNIQFDASKATTSDWIVMGSGLVLLIFSFFGWVSMSASLGDLGGYSSSLGAWNEYWWIATLLGLAVAVVVALRATLGQQLEQIKPLFLVIGAGLGFVITLIALIEIFTKGESGLGFSVGPGFGIWVCLIVSAAQTYFVWMWAQKQPGWTLPKLPGPANF